MVPEIRENKSARLLKAKSKVGTVECGRNGSVGELDRPCKGALPMLTSSH